MNIVDLKPLIFSFLHNAELTVDRKPIRTGSCNSLSAMPGTGVSDFGQAGSTASHLKPITAVSCYQRANVFFKEKRNFKKKRRLIKKRLRKS
ncbi:hypothetical protein RA263_19905 [Pseudomonas syringae pv. tagetis]|uniref:Uncharacterized protein n=1 Tax=Pseudomonas syringae pv. tagetis TaxID=129140 RepID=A0ABW7NQU8_9PSED|nr:hypothetical protein [Pseudomonas syringae group genomosp. 7]UNB69348.1 hypothetical protein MME58_03560 [Pseudomonas syringae pv. tagetis]